MGLFDEDYLLKAREMNDAFNEHIDAALDGSAPAKESYGAAVEVVDVFEREMDKEIYGDEPLTIVQAARIDLEKAKDALEDKFPELKGVLA